jgi:putative membrane-bound dehydrogenase-like protein
MKWLLILLTALPLADAAPVPLFDGKTLAGWEMPAGEEKWWRVMDGMIVGGSLEQKVPTNLFLSSAREFQNFELTFKIRLVKGAGFMNSGMQVRSARDAGKPHMSGYQVDAGIGYWGDLYDEHRRDKKLTGSVDSAALAKVVKDWEWNDYRIVCEGRQIRSWINGQPAVDFTETDPAIPLDGKLGIQVHAGGTLLVQLKDISITELPATPGAPSWKAPKPAIKQQNTEGSAAKTPEEERQSFQLPEGFVAELVTSEEQGVGKPITMAWDARGRLWTMTALEYPVDANENRANAEALYARGGKDQVLVIDHPERSGPQTARVFAEGLALPMGLLPDLDGNGAFVQYGSQIRRYLDTDKDGKADKFDVVLEGFGIQDSHLLPHQFERAPGGWIYVAQGLFNDSTVRRPGGLPFADGSKEKAFKACKLARFRPDGSDFELVSAGPNNIWGFFQTRAGETFLQEANDMGIPVTEYEPGTHYATGSNEKLRPYAPQIPASMKPIMGGTGLSGLAVAEDRDSAFAKAYGGDHVIYVANPITGRIQVITTKVEENRHPEYSKREDFLVSSDPCFRPVSIHFGPDGFLYIADWYNKIISHNEVPRAHPDRDKTRGRIWRIRPVGAETPAPVDLTKFSDDQVIELLGGPSARTAAMAWAWLGERKNPGTLAKLARITVDPKAAMAHRLDAFWALELGKAVTPAILQSFIADPSSAVRYQAVRAAGELQIAPAEFVSLLDKTPDDPSYRVRAALANAVRGHRAPSPEMMALVARLGREPLDAAGQWGKYDREFERYLARWAMETHSDETAKMLESDRSLSQESRLLAILALEPASAAALLVKDLPSLSRPLTKDELTLLGAQITQPAVLAAFQLLLGDEARRKPVLQNLTRLDANSLANPVLAAAVSAACDAMLSKSPNAEDRALVLKLVRLFRLASLEPVIAAEIKAGARPDDLVQTLSALREIESNRVDLFAGLLDHPDDAVRREATSALAFSSDIKSVDLLAARWAKLPGAVRTIAVDGLTSSKEKAVAFAKAASVGAFPGLDAGAFEKLIAVLGRADVSLAALMEKTAGMFRSVIRVPGKGGQNAPLDLTAAFTIETWIKFDPCIDNNDSLLGTAGGADFNFYQSRLRVYGGKDAGNLITANRALVPDVWVHCAVTRDTEGNFRFYFDGELDQDKCRPYREPLVGLKIGEANTGQPAAARYDEFRIWNVARSADEIRASFRTRLGQETPEHLLNKFTGEAPGNLGTEMTHDFPALVTPAEAAAAAAKFAKFTAMTGKPGDPAAGRALFQASCMICHLVKGEGQQIGPDLSGVGAMGIQAVLRNVLDPNAQLESGYYRHDVSLMDGSLISGFLVEETKESLTIRPIGADPKVIPLASIANHTISKRSLMPEGLIEGFSEKQVADLFSYINSLK